MSFDHRDATRLITFDPPLPRRAFAISFSGSTTDLDTFGGGGQDGVKYGKFTVDTSSWTGVNSLGVPPMSPGDRFQVWTWNGNNHPFTPSTGMPNYAGSAPDIIKVDYMTGEETGITTSPNPGWVMKYPTVKTCIGAKQSGTNSWDVFYSPYASDSIDTTADGIVTLQEPKNGIWLGTLAYEQDMSYSWAIPGGPTNLSFTLTMPITSRPQALNPGRIVQAWRGGSCIWEGIIQEPTPTSTGYACTANGAGTYGQNYAAVYTKWNADEPINEAINRGLRWRNDGIGKPTGIFVQNPQDTGSFVIQDFLNQLCTGGQLYWTLEPPNSVRPPAGPWTIRLRTFPNDFDGNPLSAGLGTPEQWQINNWVRTDLKRFLPRLPPELYIVNTNPIARTITNDYNTLWIKHQLTADTPAKSNPKSPAKAATFETICVDNPASVAKHGRVEYYLDVTNAGVMTQAQVIAIGQNILTHYVRANYAQAFTVQPGQLVNNGGTPVDLGCNHVGKVASVQVVTEEFGGEVSYGTVNFLVGDYAFDNTTQTATLTPYQSQFSDISSVIAALYPGKFA